MKNAFKITNELPNMSLVGITISIALFSFGEAICLYYEMTDFFHRNYNLLIFLVYEDSVNQS